MTDARWEVRGEKAGRLTVRLTYTSRDPAEWGVDFLSDDEIRINFLTSDSPPAIYKRKR